MNLDRETELVNAYEVGDLIDVSPQEVIAMAANGRLPMPVIHCGRCHWRKAEIWPSRGTRHRCRAAGSAAPRSTGVIEGLQNLIYEFETLTKEGLPL